MAAPTATPPPLPLAKPTIDYSTGRPVKLWTVGTLVYTTGGLALLFFWLLLGDFALNLRDRSVGPVVQLFLKREGASDTVMAILLSSLPPLLGMILGPIVSYRSDRLRSRWGRRIPYLIIPTPIAALAMVGIALTPLVADWLYPMLDGHFSKTTVTIAVFGVFWTIFEVAAIVSASVFGGLINDVVPRPVLGRFFGLFRAISLIDGMIFNFFLLQWAETHFLEMFTAIAIVFGVGFVLMCLMVREGQYPPPHELDGVGPDERRGFFHAAGTYFRECYSKPHYLWCFAAFTLGTITFMPINVFSINWAKQLNIDMGYYGKLVAGSYLVSLCLAYPLGALVDRFHSVRVGLVALIIYAISTAWGAWAIHDATTFGIALVAHTVLSGTYFTATASMGQALLPRSKFSQFASAGGIVSSLAAMCVGPALGLVLDTSNHNYRLTYITGFFLAVVAVCVLFVVYRRFMAMGGPKGYIAPGDTVADLVTPAGPVRGH